MAKLHFSALALLILPFTACADHDLGKACPLTLDDASTETSQNVTLVNEVVSQDLKFNCASFICIATKGSNGYCSQKCRNDAGCPEGFTCRAVQEIGPFANDKFCAYKECRSAADCGDEDVFTCQTINGIHPTEEIKLCQYKKAK